jgi:hypothetical protein
MSYARPGLPGNNDVVDFHLMDAAPMYLFRSSGQATGERTPYGSSPVEPVTLPWWLLSAEKCTNSTQMSPNFLSSFAT